MAEAGVELEAYCARDPERSRRGEPAAEILSAAKDRRTCEVVEAAGVEPASENVTGQETTCLFAFMPRAFAALRRIPQDVRGARSERTRNARH